MLSVLALVAIAGCATKIDQLRTTSRDQEKYQNPYLNEAVKPKFDDGQVPGVVWLTKGSGKVAQISLGKKDGVHKGTKIQFFEVLERGNKLIRDPFAKGKVLRAENDRSWVEIDSYKRAGVKQNHFCRIAPDQSKSMVEKVTGLFDDNEEK